MKNLRLYFHSMQMNLRAHFEYKLSFFLQFLGQFVMLFGEFLAVVLVVDRFHGVKQFNGNDLLFFFGILSVEFYTCEFFFRGITNFSPYVKNGRLDTFFLRPRGIVTQIISYEMDVRRIGAILVGVFALFLSIHNASIHFTFLKTLIFLLSMVGGCSLIVGLFMLDASLTIFSVQSIEIFNIFTYGGRSTAQYPLTIYKQPIKLLFMYVVPFFFTTQVPAAYILDKEIYTFSSPLWAFITPFSGILFLCVAYFILRIALLNYRSTGS